VSLTRNRTKTGSGTSGDPRDPLHKLVRAHGNTAEYAPMFAVLFFLIGSASPAAWEQWCIGIATACRYAIVVGLIASPTLERPHPLRFAGALGTYVTGLVLSAALFARL
jgi:hypothetical protein